MIHSLYTSIALAAMTNSRFFYVQTFLTKFCLYNKEVILKLSKQNNYLKSTKRLFDFMVLDVFNNFISIGLYL